MKFQVTMKTPDALGFAIQQVIESELEENCTDDLMDDIEQIDSEQIKDICKKWFKYEELVTLEIDTEKLTCTVLEN
jgi:hypothetical protein